MRWNAARLSRKGVGAVVVIGILVVAWWWPGLAGQDRQTDVLLVSSSSLLQAQEFIDRRLREEGFTTEWTPLDRDRCAIEVPRNKSFEVLVLEVNSSPSCDTELLSSSLSELRVALPSRSVIAVVNWKGPDVPDWLNQTVRTLNMTLVDPRELIGSEGESQSCFWWDDCPLDGRIVTVKDGSLTDAGMQRLARSIVTGVLQ
ncbi:MAG: hypothetical protein ACKOI2_09025 [Actinomycetota bacterium]